MAASGSLLNTFWISSCAEWCWHTIDCAWYICKICEESSPLRGKITVNRPFLAAPLLRQAFDTRVGLVLVTYIVLLPFYVAHFLLVLYMLWGTRARCRWSESRSVSLYCGSIYMEGFFFFFHCSVILMRDICTPTQSKYNHLEIFLAFEKIMFLTHLLLLHSSNTKVERNKNVAIKICTAYSVWGQGKNFVTVARECLTTFSWT